MISRTVVSRRPTSVGALVLGVLACVAVALALSATPALAGEACPGNETLRLESRTSPTTGLPYSASLLDCRAYEMVSPLDKQGHDGGKLVDGLLVAPDGETAGWFSEGAFSNPENYRVNYEPENPYRSLRGLSGWDTVSAFAPHNLLGVPNVTGLDGDSSPDLRSARWNCGRSVASKGEVFTNGEGLTCTMIKEGGEWGPNPPVVFTNLQSGQVPDNIDYIGGSSPESGPLRVVIQPQTTTLLEKDEVGLSSSGAGLYEISGLGTALQHLRLVNVDSNGNLLLLTHELPNHKVLREAPLLGDYRPNNPTGILGGDGSDYHAVSASGERIFFTASPVGGARQFVYARVHCVHTTETERTCTEDNEGHPPGEKSNELLETVAVSSPSHAECEACLSQIAVEHVTTTSASKTVTVPSGGFPGVTPGMSVSGPAILSGTIVSSVAANSLTLSDAATAGGAGVKLTFSTAQNAIFVGASADGSKVFFETEQTLLNNDTTTNLYEYDFNNEEGKKLVLLSPDSEAEGAKVGSIVSTSSDGSHVYFVAQGKLTNEKNEYGEEAIKGDSNLYGYGCEKVAGVAMCKIKFVAVAPALGGNAQITPDGRDLVFSVATVQASLAGNKNSSSAQAVYLYDFQTGKLTWISHAAGEPKPPEPGKGAVVVAKPITGQAAIGAFASVDDWSRTISGCPAEVSRECKEEGEHDGEYITFTTSEQLQANDTNNAPDVYEWHNGTVSMISDGHDPAGAIKEGASEAAVAMSASGWDIFFTTGTPLVGQDTDALRDLYDARVGGGFRKPPAELSCRPQSEGGCQGKASALPSFGLAASALLTPGGNLPPPGGGVVGFNIAKPKPLTRAQQLAKALKACKGKPKTKRAVCESQARKAYAKPLTRAQQLAKALKACKGKPKKKRAVCEPQARKKYAGKAKNSARSAK